MFRRGEFSRQGAQPVQAQYLAKREIQRRDFAGLLAGVARQKRNIQR